MEQIPRFSDRLGELLDKHNATASELARHCGVTPQAAQQWLRGITTPRKEKMAEIAQFFGLSPAQLMFGKDAPGDTATPATGNAELLSGDMGLVPLISYVQAGTWNEATDPYMVGDCETMLACPVKHSSRTFALRVRGLSMFNPSERPSFQDGDIIFCDPDVEANNKSLVIARLDGSNEATFKRLLLDSEKMYLEALNPAWPNRIFEAPEDTTLCGVVIARLDTFQ